MTTEYVNYPISVTAEGYGVERRDTALPGIAAEAWRWVLRHWGLLAALAITFAVHAPTLRYFFDGDDFVVLGDIQHRGNAQFLIDTLRMHDAAPSWRPLTGAIYMLEWRAFGLDAMGWRIVNLSVHLGSMVLLYALVVRLTRRPAIAAVSTLVFGVSGAHFDSVTYVTALPHVLATFFLLGSLLALIAYVEDGETRKPAFLLSLALFTLGFLANEATFVFAPLLVAAYALYSKRWLRSPLRLVLHAAPFVALAAGWLSFYESCTCDQLKFDGYSWGPHVIGNYAVYLSYMAYPAHHVPLTPDTMSWTLASLVAAAGLWFLVRGPHLARLAVLGLALALLPFVPVEIWTASRYMYAAVAFFAPGAAIASYWIYDRVRRTHRIVRVPATVVALAFVAVVASLYAWQTFAQDSRSGRGTERWRMLVEQLDANYASVPPGTTIYIIDGPWTNPMEQYAWVPSVGRALYSDAVVFDLPREAYVTDPPATKQALYLRYEDGRLEPVASAAVTTSH